MTQVMQKIPDTDAPRLRRAGIVLMADDERKGAMGPKASSGIGRSARFVNAEYLNHLGDLP